MSKQKDRYIIARKSDGHTLYYAGSEKMITIVSEDRTGAIVYYSSNAAKDALFKLNNRRRCINDNSWELVKL